MLVRDDLLEDQSVNEDSHRSHVRREDLQAVEPLVVNAEVRESPHEDNIVEEEADVVLGEIVEYFDDERIFGVEVKIHGIGVLNSRRAIRHSPCVCVSCVTSETCQR